MEDPRKQNTGAAGKPKEAEITEVDESMEVLEPVDDSLGKANRAFKLGNWLAKGEKRGGADEVSPEVAEEDVAESVGDSIDEELERLRAEAAENYDKYLRAVAELENYKKRALRERSDLLRYAGEHLARDLVEVVDDVERAVVQDKSVSAESLLEGIRLIGERFRSILDKHSITGVDALGKKFDPSKEEALATVPTDKCEPGMVIEQFRKAYFFKDKLLRSGQVVVSAAPVSKNGGNQDS